MVHPRHRCHRALRRPACHAARALNAPAAGPPPAVAGDQPFSPVWRCRAEWTRSARRTSTMPVPSHAQNGAGARVSALLIPADPERPVQRLEISGKDDLSAALGGHIEGVPCHHDSTIWGYVNTLGKYTAGGEPNARASSVLSPGKGWITGDVVLIAFDEHREECDLPIGIEDRITATERLPTAPLMIRAGRSIVHEWEVNSSDNGSQLQIGRASCREREEIS